MFTRTGVAVAVSAVVLVAAGAVANYPELVMVGLAGVVALLVAATWMLWRPQITAVREIRPQRVTEGSPASAVLTLTNTGPRRSPPLVVTETIADRSTSVPLRSLAAGTSYETTYPLPTTRRGRYLISGLTIGHSDPLRLLHIGRKTGSESVLYVHPRVYDIAPVPIGGPRDAEGSTSARSPLGGMAFHSLRDYSPGDDWRLIDWKSTARTGTLVVRHNVVPDEPRHLIVLDTRAHDGFEDTVRVAASLCVAASRSGFPIDLRVTRSATESAHTEIQALDVLASIESSAGDRGLSTLPEIIHDALATNEGCALAVVTGQASLDDLDLLSAVRPHFLTASLIQIGHSPSPAPPGVIAVDATSSERFAATWNQLVPQ
ncbi:DUF58 domain-containing protein [Kibdelosporangium aridum]|uniref:DUF58 domain-containing protein n=1 Tax=Kibdelosporangium aridum TaxID=2030 RepID=A0A428ZQS3_KIBAR|nr:DUF58 domain-containing protein [Kibdelosporangium aridum]RSM90414.1 DUF58 domain-containing protein [Kibdelosporangium aridum]